MIVSMRTSCLRRLSDQSLFYRLPIFKTLQRTFSSKKSLQQPSTFTKSVAQAKPAPNMHEDKPDLFQQKELLKKWMESTGKVAPNYLGLAMAVSSLPLFVSGFSILTTPLEDPSFQSYLMQAGMTVLGTNLFYVDYSSPRTR